MEALARAPPPPLLLPLASNNISAGYYWRRYNSAGTFYSCSGSRSISYFSVQSASTPIRTSTVVPARHILHFPAPFQSRAHQAHPFRHTHVSWQRQSHHPHFRPTKQQFKQLLGASATNIPATAACPPLANETPRSCTPTLSLWPESARHCHRQFWASPRHLRR
jgi:hypothetical protein